MRVWNATSGEQLSLLTHNLQPVVSNVANRDGALLAAVEATGTVDLYEPLPGRVIGRYDPVLSAAFSPDGSRFVLVGPGGVGLLDSNSGRLLKVISRAGGSLSEPIFSRDGSLVAIPGVTATRVIDLHTGRSVTLANSPAPNALAGFEVPVGNFSPDDRVYAQGTTRGAVMLWSTATGQSVGHLRSHAGVVDSVQFSPDGQLVASAGSDGYTYIQRADGQGPVSVLRSPGAVSGSVSPRTAACSRPRHCQSRPQQTPSSSGARQPAANWAPRAPTLVSSSSSSWAADG